MEEKSSDPRYAGGWVSRMPEKIGRTAGPWLAEPLPSALRGRAHPALGVDARKVLGAVGLCLLLTTGGCTPATSEPGWTGSETLYTRRDALLFDDLFRPELFGVEHTVEPPERDPKLQERTAFADSVSRTKVVTVTRGGALNGASYTIVLRPQGKPLAGRALPDPVTLIITRSSPIYAWLEGAGQGWVGTKVVLFARAFADGLHYHATTDSEPVRKIIEHAAAMSIVNP